MKNKSEGKGKKDNRKVGGGGEIVRTEGNNEKVKVKWKVKVKQGADNCGGK